MNLRMLLATALLAVPCKDKESTAIDPNAPTRGYRMGFSAFPPRFDDATVMSVIDHWSPRADAAIITGGLNRTAEAPELRALGRSITEPAIQALYRQFAPSIGRLVQPQYLGLAAETNRCSRCAAVRRSQSRRRFAAATIAPVPA